MARVKPIAYQRKKYFSPSFIKKTTKEPWDLNESPPLNENEFHCVAEDCYYKRKSSKEVTCSDPIYMVPHIDIPTMPVRPIKHQNGLVTIVANTKIESEVPVLSDSELYNFTEKYLVNNDGLVDLSRDRLAKFNENLCGFYEYQVKLDDYIKYTEMWQQKVLQTDIMRLEKNVYDIDIKTLFEADEKEDRKENSPGIPGRTTIDTNHSSSSVEEDIGQVTNDKCNSERGFWSPWEKSENTFEEESESSFETISDCFGDTSVETTKTDSECTYDFVKEYIGTEYNNDWTNAPIEECFESSVEEVEKSVEDVTNPCAASENNERKISEISEMIWDLQINLKNNLTAYRVIEEGLIFLLKNQQIIA